MPNMITSDLLRQFSYASGETISFITTIQVDKGPTANNICSITLARTCKTPSLCIDAIVIAYRGLCNARNGKVS